LNYAKIGLLPEGYFSLHKPEKVYKFAPSPSETTRVFRATIAERREIYSTLKSKIENDPDGKLENLLTKYVKSGLFSERIGLVKGVQAKIRMKDSLPYRSNLRPVNNETKKIIDEEIDNWLQQNIIAKAEPGEAKFVSPLHVVKKKKLPGETVQKYRLVCDQRCLNSRCIPEPPLNPPRSELIFSKMSNAKYFSKIDLKNAYLQIGSVVKQKNTALSRADIGFVSSLSNKYKAPYKISRLVGKNSCILETLDGKPAGKRHAEDLGLYTGKPDWAQ